MRLSLVRQWSMHDRLAEQAPPPAIMLLVLLPGTASILYWATASGGPSMRRGC